MNPTKVILLSIDAGGGHRAAANALMDVIRQQQRPWEVELVSIQDVLAPIDFIRKSTGIAFQDVYNIMLRRGWTLGTAQLIPVMHGLIQVSHSSQVDVLRRFWSGARPDIVVSLIPHYNRSVKQALDQVWPGTPYVTVLTDIADYPPHFWIERMDQDVICGSAKAVEQARLLGLPESRIRRSSGMIVHPRFYTPLEVDRAAERKRHGLRADLPTGLVLFGGEGSSEMLRIAKSLDRSGLPLQLILLCGHNQTIRGELRQMTKRSPMLIEGFTREVPYYMELADFFIGKPGPGSISEALCKRLPVIVQRNAWTMAQELYNTEWVEEKGVGLVVSDFGRSLTEAVQTLLEPAAYESFRQRTAAVPNYAVFEIPEMVASMLAGGTAGRKHAAVSSSGRNTETQLGSTQ